MIRRTFARPVGFASRPTRLAGAASRQPPQSVSMDEVLAVDELARLLVAVLRSRPESPLRRDDRLPRLAASSRALGDEVTLRVDRAAQDPTVVRLYAHTPSVRGRLRRTRRFVAG